MYDWQREGQKGMNNHSWKGEKRKTQREISMKYRHSHREQCRERLKKYRKLNIEKVKIWRKTSLSNMLHKWVGIVPLKTFCEMCGKEIFYNGGNKATSIHFDHKSRKAPIKISPSTWLMSHQRNTKNELIWKSCDFGMLCERCNRHLPTDNREQFVKNAIKYVFGKNLTNV